MRGVAHLDTAAVRNAGFLDAGLHYDVGGSACDHGINVHVVVGDRGVAQSPEHVEIRIARRLDGEALRGRQRVAGGQSRCARVQRKRLRGIGKRRELDRQIARRGQDDVVLTVRQPADCRAAGVIFTSSPPKN